MFSAKDSCIKYERICRKSEFALNQMKNFFVQCKCKDYISTPFPQKPPARIRTQTVLYLSPSSDSTGGKIKKTSYCRAYLDKIHNNLNLRKNSFFKSNFCFVLHLKVYETFGCRFAVTHQRRNVKNK